MKEIIIFILGVNAGVTFLFFISQRIRIEIIKFLDKLDIKTPFA